MMRHPAVRAQDLSVGYRVRRATCAVLEHINVSVDHGEFVCLLGPNGIGKSTLLRTLAGMQAPLAGSVHLGGMDLQRIGTAERARRLGVVLTDRVAVEALPVRRIVELGRYPHSNWLGGLGERDHEVVDWAIRAVNAECLADRDFSRLSDGERQRVMIARALAQEPTVLVLDEPTAFLDLPSRVELMGMLGRLSRDTRLAIVVSTHDLELALRTADTVWLLMPGGEMLAGAPEDVVVAGGIARAFEGQHVRFDPEARTFRLSTGQRGAASVRGSGLRAAMARAVLEREGFTPNADALGPHAVIVDVDDDGWRTSGDLGGAAGASFAALSAFLNNGRSTG
jgi:iron complex transport system ATP-binding protein